MIQKRDFVIADLASGAMLFSRVMMITMEMTLFVQPVTAADVSVVRSKIMRNRNTAGLELHVLREIPFPKRDSHTRFVFQSPSGVKYRIDEFQGEFYISRKYTTHGRYRILTIHKTMDHAKSQIMNIDSRFARIRIPDPETKRFVERIQESVGKEIQEKSQERKPGRPALDPDLVKKSHSIRISDADLSFLEEKFKGTIQEFIDFQISKLRGKK